MHLSTIVKPAACTLHASSCAAVHALQAEASYFAKPRFMGADLELHCAAPGADLLPLATGPTTAPPFDPLAANQPLHLRVAGHAKLSLRPTQHAAQQQAAPTGAGRPGDALSPKHFEGRV